MKPDCNKNSVTSLNLYMPCKQLYNEIHILFHIDIRIHTYFIQYILFRQTMPLDVELVKIT
jgi:hypothetical protein